MYSAIMAALSIDPTSLDSTENACKPLSYDEFRKILEQIEQVDAALKEHFGYNLLSGEGRVLLSTIKNNGSMLKVIANSANFSYRTAYNSLKKLENFDIIKRNSENEDLRRVIIQLDVDRIISLLDRDPFMLNH